MNNWLYGFMCGYLRKSAGAQDVRVGGNTTAGMARSVLAGGEEGEKVVNEFAAPWYRPFGEKRIGGMIPDTVTKAPTGEEVTAANTARKAKQGV